jgi:hypothetical protein
LGDVYDLDALEHEAEEEPFFFRFGGEEYVLPPHLDIRAAAALGGGRIDDGLRILLGAEQWTRLQQADAVFDDRHLVALLEEYSSHIGVTLGELPASPSSLPSTAGPSKRTSRGTTKRH